MNLTGADTVIHFDPWWNPAVEEQATDRAYRIGQRRKSTGNPLCDEKFDRRKDLQIAKEEKGIIQSCDRYRRGFH